MYMLGKSDYINKSLLLKFITDCQDEDGGIADRPGNQPDVFHTFFGLAGMALLGNEKLNEFDPFFAIPTTIVKKLIK